jgi:hypothetical protein
VVRTALITVLLAVASTCVHGETLLALAGITNPDSSATNTYAWQFELQEPMSRYLGGSLSWLNEGHVPYHHRDGVATQLWLTAPRWLDRFVFSAGAGPYIYFDTKTASSDRGYSDIHSAAALVSASLWVDLRSSWFLSLRVNDVLAPGDFNSTMWLLGGGYHFGGFEHGDAANRGAGTSVAYARQQVQVFAGTMIYNQLESHSDRTVGLEYRLALLPWAAWSASWFYNPVNASAQRDQVASQLWLVDTLMGGKLSLSAGLGVYTPLGSRPEGAANNPASLSGLSALRAEWNWSSRSSVILSWHRSFTNDDDDRDIITLGYGFRFGG